MSEDTQKEQVLDFDDLSKSLAPGQEETQPETEEPESQPEGQEEPEVRKEEEQPEVQEEAPMEYVIVDGEEIPVDLNEIIGTKPDGTPIYLRDTDNPKSYKYFQSRDKKKDNKIADLENKIQQLARQEQPKGQAPQKPKLPPPRPQSYDPTEAITDPSSESYKWREQVEQYQYDKAVWDSHVDEQREQQEKSRLEQEQLAKQKAALISQFQSAGAKSDEATKVHGWYEKVLTQYTPQELLNIYRIVHKQNPQTQQRVETHKRQGQQQGTIPLPPSATPSQAEPEEPEFGDFLLQQAKKLRV